mmetsp:Transcript_99828/g.281838  ORF Transcript_99828/g.281838 Transcript_99828/m.281838 type:complete len:358 (+) Transcript_99828:418-1491(+)
MAPLPPRPLPATTRRGNPEGTPAAPRLHASPRTRTPLADRRSGGCRARRPPAAAAPRGGGRGPATPTAAGHVATALKTGGDSEADRIGARRPPRNEAVPLQGIARRAGRMGLRRRKRRARSARTTGATRGSRRTRIPAPPGSGVATPPSSLQPRTRRRALPATTPRRSQRSSGLSAKARTKRRTSRTRRKRMRRRTTTRRQESMRGKRRKGRMVVRAKTVGNLKAMPKSGLVRHVHRPRRRSGLARHVHRPRRRKEQAAQPRLSRALVPLHGKQQIHGRRRKFPRKRSGQADRRPVRTRATSMSTTAAPTRTRSPLRKTFERRSTRRRALLLLWRAAAPWLLCRHRWSRPGARRARR